jgi:hypothetical protein
MEDDKDYFRLITGKKLEEATRIPSLEETLNKQFKQHRSKKPLRTLGVGQESIFISEEEREANVHIIGAPSEGKSKFLEDSIRKDIDAGLGLTLLDSSDGGKTCHDVLKYCAYKGHKKVVLIDPRTLYDHGKIAAIKLLDKYEKLSIDGIFEAVNILFNTKSTETPRIKRHLSALLKVLSKSKLTLAETSYFSTYSRGGDVRERLLESLPESDRDRITIQELYTSKYHFETYFSSTINRLDMFWDEPLSLMFGSDTGIDFVKMISEGWTILVNLAPGKYLSQTDSQLLGVLVISQLIKAADILFEAEPRGKYKRVHYLYIDEAGRFATPQIDTLLSYKRKSGLRLIIAHHFFNQFENKKVLDSVKQSARIKVMFNTPSYEDRLEMSKLLGYGGDISPLDASFANQDLRRQYAIIKKNKETPKRVRVPDVPETKIGKETFDSYVKELLAQKWYVTREEINNQANKRIESVDRKTPTNPRAAGGRKVANKRPARKTVFD